MKSDAKTMDHSLKLESDVLKAGGHYYFRITSDDGSGPATADGEFDTKSIPVIINITDTNNKPVEGADITIGDQSSTSDDTGQAAFDLPEGDVTITAQKDDLSKEITATINVPTDDTPAQLSLSLSKGVKAPTVVKKSNKSGMPLWAKIILSLVGLAAVAAAVILFLRRRNAKAAQLPAYVGDALEAENYTSATPIPTTLPEPSIAIQSSFEPAPIPSTPEPNYQQLPAAAVPQHQSLPELVGRYGAAAPEQSSGYVDPSSPRPLPATAPEDPSSVTSPIGSPIPHHTSLKELVVTEPVDSTVPVAADAVQSDLPVSPITAGYEPESYSPVQSADNDVNPDQPANNDGSLSIEHAK
jgi:hypothetical protein